MLKRRPSFPLRARLFALALAAGFPAWTSAALDLEPLWTADPDMIMEGAAMAVDLDADGDDEVITAAYESIIAVDGSGAEIWRFDTRGRYSTCPALLERPGQPPLIYAGDNKNLFTCLDGHAKVVWQRDLTSMFCSGPALADLDGDGAAEVVQGALDGMVYVLDALTGKDVWQKQLEGNCSSPAIADLDGDGAQEVIFATGTGRVTVFDASGAIRWTFDAGSTAPEWAIPSPIAFGMSSGAVCVAAASHEGRLYCLDADGGVLWDRAVRGAIASTLSAGDLDADGRADLFVVTELGVLYRFNEDGRVLWDIDTQGRSLASGAIIDIDGDGALEYALSTQRGNFLIFNVSGEIIFNHQFDSRTINVTPAFGDIVPDRPGLELAITGGESGRMFCFGTPAPLDTPAPWSTYRGDNRLTGAWFGLARAGEARMAPGENLDWDRIVTGAAAAFTITNPHPGEAPLTASAACIRPDGARQVAVGKVVGQSGRLELPLTLTAPGVYRFEWTLKDASGAALTGGSREVTLVPYRNDQARAARTVRALLAAAKSAETDNADKGIAAALRQEAQAVELEAKALAALQAAAPGAEAAFCEDVDARTTALNVRAARSEALAEVIEGLTPEALNRGFVVFQGTQWENRGVDRQLPEHIESPLAVAKRCVPGEHQPLSLKVLNITLYPKTIRVRVEGESDGIAATAYEVKPVPTNQGTVAWDPLVPLGEGTLTVPPLEAREVWLDLDAGAAEPGVHEVAVVFDGGAASASAEVTLDVLPFEMAGAGAFRLCCWSRYNEDAVRDLLAHGNTVFTASLPAATVGEGSAPSISIDFTELDAFVDPLAGHDVFLLLNGAPALGVPREEAAYVPRLADYLDQVMAHLESKGIPEKHVALYPHDEPGGQGWDTVNDYIAFARQGLAARPSLQFYVNGGGDLAMFKALNEVAAIWCPGFYMLAESMPEMDFMRESGKILWSYDCGYAYARPIGANTKTINIVAQYRLEAVHGFIFGAEGIGYWCYNAGDCMWEPVELEYPLVYANPDGTHTASRRWEAVRESMEDVRILAALKEKLTDENVSAEAKQRIRLLLEETLPAQAEQSLAEVRLGVARYVLDATNNDETINGLREAMMDCIAALGE